MVTVFGEADDGSLKALLDSLGYDLEPSILIGGWATHARVGGEISHDIDLIINDQNLRRTLIERLDNYSENTIHSGGRKARGDADGVHVDAYFPYESKLGTRLKLDVGCLTNFVDSEFRVNGWLTLTLDAHIATKMAALLDRHSTEKGRKDARELVALIEVGATSEGVVDVLYGATAGPEEDIPDYIRETFTLIPRLASLNKKQKATYSRLAREWVDEAEVQLRRRTGSMTSPSL